MLDALINPVTIFLFGVVLLGSGFAGYRGKIKRWWVYRENYVFHSLPAHVTAGIALVLSGPMFYFPDSWNGHWLVKIYGVTICLLLGVSGIAIFWVPRWALPKWYVADRDAFRANKRLLEYLSDERKKFEKRPAVVCLKRKWNDHQKRVLFRIVQD